MASNKTALRRLMTEVPLSFLHSGDSPPRAPAHTPADRASESACAVQAIERVGERRQHVHRRYAVHLSTRLGSLNFVRSDPRHACTCTGPVTEDDFFTWSCLISGPGNLAYYLSVACRSRADRMHLHSEDTPFEGGVFQAELKFPRDYPLNPPKVRRQSSRPEPGVCLTPLLESQQMRFDPPLFHPNSESLHSLQSSKKGHH